MSIGYACQTVGVLNTGQKSCIMKNASETNLLSLIDHNLGSFENIVDYNIKNDIKLFRISSDLIPFGSSLVNNICWWEIFEKQVQKISEKIRISGMRVSMHPGQYTVLNSPNIDVVTKAIDDLNYHAVVLDSFKATAKSKIVLHIGGVYNDKKQAIKRFIANYRNLDSSVKNRLVLENDDKSYNIDDVLEIGTMLDVPVIFDNLHNEINSCDNQKSAFYWIDECRKTWKENDGHQKIHYSQQDPLKRAGSHSSSIRINEFMSFYENLGRSDIDIMLEVKDKNLSAVKCINSTTYGKKIKTLEVEWSKYKYLVLENSPLDYVEIRKLLLNKNDYPVISFYNLIEDAILKESSIGTSVNAALHIWSYFKDNASDKEKNKFFNNIDFYNQGKIPIKTIKNILWKLAIKYQQSYLLDSYYFAY